MNEDLQSENEIEKVKTLLERKSKEVEIIKQISNQINKSLDLLFSYTFLTFFNFI